ncbi:NADH2 dehydrogenase 14K chain [Piedraia hortae CBS 480.64]|uniref:NADH2 dehydrogenase 14K chain n=1 Tax=Piedraia hortae CBS 480.64 TaxID=1314780 RepID=A0A6A7C826_9PEZI|nr:NADH2 dehydrogenase 14K chain [Piedraia hortae CBS 480.64]
MVSKILFWSGFGLAVRFWQLGIEMRPFMTKPYLYPFYCAIGASFGYYLQGVDEKQKRFLEEARERLMQKRLRRLEREGAEMGIGAAQ